MGALCVLLSAFLAECRRAKAAADGRTFARTDSLARTFANPFFSRAQVDTHATTTTTISLRVSHRLHLPTLATSKLQNPAFSGLVSRDARTVHSPRLVEPRQTAFFFSPISLCFKPLLVEARQTACSRPHFLVRQASFFAGVRKSSNSNRCTYLPAPGKSVHCNERERERERERETFASASGLFPTIPQNSRTP
jgi:hypothetical protein